jgi:glycosyltransferase involved in cell wall biosynthesis
VRVEVGRLSVRFAIVTAAWQCERWIGRGIASLRAQTHADFRAVIIDDDSSDRTYERALATADGDPRFSIIRADQRAGALANIVRATTLAARDDDDVIVIVDGDDWLKHERVLERLAALYADPDVWLSYGSFELHRPRWRDRLRLRPTRGQSRAFPESVARLGLFRYNNGPWCASHLRAYRKFLWDGLRDADLRDDDGQYFSSAADVATMLPLLEMATAQHIRFVPDILYVYNNDHPLSDNREAVRASERQQFICALKIRARQRYAPLLLAAEGRSRASTA